MGYIRSERWKAQTEEYQLLMASGQVAEARKFKRSLAAMVIAGRCKGSHAEENLEQWSGDSMLDVDHSHGRIPAFWRILKSTGWVKAAWRSVSYDGVKLVVRVEAENADEYRLAYAIVAWHVAQLLDFPCDMSCKNPTRPCFVSYDPEAFFRPDAEVFPWRRFMEEHPEKVGEILEELKVKTSETERNIPQNAGVSDAGAQTAEADPSGDPAPASGLLRTFFNDFLSHNPFMDGKKNDFLLKLGRIARYKGMTGEELDQLKALAVSAMPCEI